jgi:hypothetical protein
MSKRVSITLLTLLFTVASFSQSFDWNLRGGLNLMNSKSADKNLALSYHIGAQAGIRITSFGFYGEAAYSLLEDQYGGEPIAYFTPAILLKVQLKRMIFSEIGGMFLSRIDDSDGGTDSLNPDNSVMPFAGLGFNVSRAEISLRSVVKQSYAIIQFTAAVKF